MVKGVYQKEGLGPLISSEDDLWKVRNKLEKDIIPSLRLWEYFVIQVDEALAEFEATLKKGQFAATTSLYHGTEVNILKKEGLYRVEGGGRYSLKIHQAWAIKLFGPPKSYKKVDKQRILEAIQDYKLALDEINLPFYQKLNEDMKCAVNNVIEQIRYQRLASHGPHYDTSHPLIDPYFTTLYLPVCLNTAHHITDLRTMK